MDEERKPDQPAKKPGKRLGLNKETIRELTDQELDDVAGAGTEKCPKTSPKTCGTECTKKCYAQPTIEPPIE
jgi:hypothetical protein